ncbi:MAG: diphthamide synthesis protein [Nanoarchaeota archaeon]|nr:diphthamide synthesis protein [Nanoarchaeota archaeon]
MDYNMEIGKAVEKINANNAQKVLIQLPDGLKPRAKEIKEEIESQTDAKAFIWLGSCFGACDVPYYTERIGIDMIIQWGHSEWKSEEGYDEERESEEETYENEEQKQDTPTYGIPW